MVRDAEAQAEDDRRLRELAEARSTAEHAAHQAERQARDLAEYMSEPQKTEVEGLIADVRAALESNDAAEHDANVHALQSAFHRMSDDMYEKASARQDARRSR